MRSIVFWSGVLMLLVGVGLIVMQFLGTHFLDLESFKQAAESDSGGSITFYDVTLELQTTYVGLGLAISGAVLEIVGYLGGAPWRDA